MDADAAGPPGDRIAGVERVGCGRSAATSESGHGRQSRPVKSPFASIHPGGLGRTEGPRRIAVPGLARTAGRGNTGLSSSASDAVARQICRRPGKAPLPAARRVHRQTLSWACRSSPMMRCITALLPHQSDTPRRAVLRAFSVSVRPLNRLACILMTLHALKWQICRQHHHNAMGCQRSDKDDRFRDGERVSPGVYHPVWRRMRAAGPAASMPPGSLPPAPRSRAGRRRSSPAGSPCTTIPQLISTLIDRLIMDVIHCNVPAMQNH